MQRTINIPIILKIVCFLLISVISINKLDALTANTYIQLNGSSTDLNDGYYTYFDKNTNLIFKSIYYLEDTGNLDYYITTSVIFCSSFGVNSVYNNESQFLVSTNIKNLGTCEFDGVSDRVKEEVTWVRYLPVVNSNTQALGQVFIKFVNDKTWRLGVQIISKNVTVQSAGVYEQQQTIDKQQKTNEKLDDLNSKLTDTSAPDTSGFGNVSGWLPAGPVDSILTLPLKVMNTISGVLSGSCSLISLPLPFIDSNLDLPCGDTFYDGVTGLSVFLNTLGLIVGGYLLYCYLIYLYNWVDKKVSMVENDREKWGVV